MTQWRKSFSDYCSGACIACDDWDACNSEINQENGERQEILYDTYDFRTVSGDYRLAFKYVDIDTAEPDNVGIWSVYIIRAEEDVDLQYAYWGDHNYTPGIWIGVKNGLSEEG